MIIECDRCYARYKYDQARFEGKASKKVRCTKCLSVFEIYNATAEETETPVAVPSTPEEMVLRLSEEARKPQDTTRKNISMASVGRPGEGELKLPATAKLSVAVIAGPEAGKIFPIDKARVVIGRHDADINMDDPEISRQHAALEISGDKVVLVDLESTNGTFVEEEPVKEAPIENQGEFSIGNSTLMLIITPR
jgi:predicted Zn finger-like uncharacterized protein